MGTQNLDGRRTDRLTMDYQQTFLGVHIFKDKEGMTASLRLQGTN